ncbi:hypothetical protein KSF78_0006576 [Schistosoma japonicum]|nr:hypothetical protein KSF78_0006576 [Schistosoma japonicum]
MKLTNVIETHQSITIMSVFSRACQCHINVCFFLSVFVLTEMNLLTSLIFTRTNEPDLMVNDVFFVSFKTNQIYPWKITEWAREDS